MKYIQYTFILTLFTLSAFAQTYEDEVKVELSNPSQNGLLKIHIHDGTINISGHNQNYVLVKFKSHQKNGHKKEMGGLKRIPNSSLNVEISEYENTVEVESNNDRTDYEILVPHNFDLNASSHHNSDIVVTNVEGEIELQSHHGSIEIHEVSGSVSAETHHGKISGSFKSVDLTKPMAFSTYHGDIEITFPQNLKCNTKLKSDQGDIYTDFDIAVQPMKAEQVNESGHKKIKVGGWIYGTIGGGGKEYMFTSYHGDIILRKV